MRIWRIGDAKRLIEKAKYNPFVKSIAVQIIKRRKVPHKDYLGQARAIFDFVRSRVKYIKDPVGYDQLSPPIRTIWQGYGDCLTGETEIICYKDGLYKLKKIGDIDILNYDALSYNFEKKQFEFKPIINWWDKGEREVCQVILYNGTSFECTWDHKLFGISRWMHDFEERRLFEIDELTKKVRNKDYYNQIAVVKQIPCMNFNLEIEKEKLWLFGHYLAEGWKGNNNHTCISGKMKEVTCKLKKIGVPFTLRERGTKSYVNILNSPFKKDLAVFGNNAFNKTIPEEYLSLSKEKIVELLNGYIEGDGYLPKNRNGCRVIYQTSSDTLAKQLKLIHWILGKPLYTWYQKNHQGAGHKPIWRLYEFTGRSNYRKEVFNGISKVGIKKIIPLGKKRVFDIQVADNHNFVLANSGVIVHNCEDNAVLLASLLESIGIPTKLKLVATRGPKYDHIYVLAGIPLDSKVRWMPLDTTLARTKPMGYEVSYKKARVF